jgi:putative glutamine amidotransferase
MRPIIAVTTDRRVHGPQPDAPGRIRPARAEIHVGQAVVDHIRRAGGEPLLVPPHGGPNQALSGLIDWLLGNVHGVVITGGAFDIHPHHYGQSVGARLDRVDEGRTGLELSLAKAAMASAIPLLGICGGMQAMVVAAGGTLLQDISASVKGAIEHEQPSDPAKPHHLVKLSPSVLRECHGNKAEIEVNSTHHQAADDPGYLAIIGRASDGVVEAVSHPIHPFCIGVQWHPERLDPAPITALVQHAGRMLMDGGR